MMNSSISIGCLLIHGFTGTHYEMEPLAKFLAEKGIITKNITLPGHETTPEDHVNTKWTEIIDYAQYQLDELKNKHNKVFVAGLSMGGAITLNLGAKNPSLDGIITMSAPYKIPRWYFGIIKRVPLIHLFMKWQYNDNKDMEDRQAAQNHKSYEKYYTKSVLWLDKLIQETRKLLPLITVPSLILHSKNDTSVSLKHAEYILEHISSEDKSYSVIEKGHHVIPVDFGKEQAFSVIDDWISKRM